jgi:hypothetical protein
MHSLEFVRIRFLTHENGRGMKETGNINKIVY